MSNEDASDPVNSGIKEQILQNMDLYEASDGAEGSETGGVDLILLSTIGAKSRLIRRVLVVRVEYNGVYLAVASSAGRHRDPAWVMNLRANPRIQLRDKDRVLMAVAKEILDQDAREILWTHAVATYPPYAKLAMRTGRLFPIFTLTPVRT